MRRALGLAFVFVAACGRAPEQRAALDAETAAQRRGDCAFVAGQRAAQTVARTLPLGDELPIDTVVVAVLEGRSFDHLLGGMDGVETAPPEASNVDARGRRVPRAHATRYCDDDPGDDWQRSHVAFDGGTNGGFVRAAAAAADDPTGARVMSHYGADDLPVLHALAARFAAADHYFGSILAGPTANRAFLYAGTSHGAIDDAPIAGATPTVFDALDAAGVSWRVYTEDATRPAALAAVRARHPERFSGGFGRDAAAGTLPAVSFVEVAPQIRAGGRWDFRAPGDVQVGDRYLWELYAEVAASPSWPRLALFITFADAGGFYDHVPPPTACRPDAWGPGPSRDDLPLTFDRYGFRVPLLVVSPWARRGHVSHALYDHTSILRFLEARFGLPALGARDANADPLYDLFDFTAPSQPTPPPMPAPRLDSDEIDRCLDEYP